MKSSNFEQILDTCLVRLQSGEPIEQCLAAFPEKAGELRPLLQAAAAVQTLPFPTARPRAIEQGQGNMLAALAAQKEKPAVSFGTLGRYAGRILSVLKQEEASKMRTALRSVVTTILILFVTGFFALSISSNSLPGEPFYPVKLGWESLRFGLTFDTEARQQLDEQIQQNRREELAALIELGRQTQVVYEGLVELIEDEQLIVDGFIFETNLETKWLVEPEVEQAVRIETRIAVDGTLTALEISASGLTDSRPAIIATATPCNSPTCDPPTATPTPCNTGACGGTATVTATTTNEPGSPTPTPCNTPVCGGTSTLTPTPCSLGACGGPTQTATPVSPTPTPCNTPTCGGVTATPTPCNAGCGSPTSTPVPSNTPGNPTPTPCNSPACAPPTSTCTPGACGNPTSTPFPTNTPTGPTPTPCNSPACAPPTATPTPCNTPTCGGPTLTPLPTYTPSGPTPTPCNPGACGNPTSTPFPTNTPTGPTPTPCTGGACGNPTPSPTPCNSPVCSSQPFLPPY